MISAERAGHPADDEQPVDAHDRDQPCGSDADEPCGMPFDYIDEAIEESMIASDPPALTPQTGIGSPNRRSSPADRR